MPLLIGGVLVTVNGFLTLYLGDSTWRGTIVPAWTAWPGILLGLTVCGLAIWSMRRAKKRQRPDNGTDETDPDAPPPPTDN